MTQTQTQEQKFKEELKRRINLQDFENAELLVLKANFLPASQRVQLLQAIEKAKSGDISQLVIQLKKL